ncbi:hypothetical protein HYPBUDRAFT_154332 [Hyphopichia burtonii NRRL Y-1933]|uniref:Uncharacterized protein n=1 Tax=Hyphopichia burtonii NRRL Y-1933 TaxID=984485 RepID=A0A1E4RBK4_9ASCO|nr:hypothetical protein HYPBUDRAFT_154332 [Hyphopichia burtonii NRRL Y-1933]ODV64603.1 hypothetical protein HYPBUDRAFT_154332 [Hyphopichia burtonii NRRL Y-1933]
MLNLRMPPKGGCTKKLFSGEFEEKKRGIGSFFFQNFLLDFVAAKIYGQITRPSPTDDHPILNIRGIHL